MEINKKLIQELTKFGNINISQSELFSLNMNSKKLIELLKIGKEFIKHKSKNKEYIIIQRTHTKWELRLDESDFIGDSEADVVFKACNYFISYKSLFSKLREINK